MAAQAIGLLEDNGIAPERMSLVATEPFDRDAFTIEPGTKMPEGVAIGATSGIALGALIAGLTTVGALTAGAGLLAAGPIVAAFTGAGVGAVGGGAIGGLIGASMPEHEIRRVRDALDRGSVLVGVDVRRDADRIRELLDQAGADHIGRA